MEVNAARIVLVPSVSSQDKSVANKYGSLKRMVNAFTAKPRTFFPSGEYPTMPADVIKNAIQSSNLATRQTEEKSRSNSSSLRK